MISWVVVLDARVMGVVDGYIYQWLLGSCVEFSQTAVVLVISAWYGDAVVSPMLKNWPLFGQKFSTFGQSIQLLSHVSEVVSIFPSKVK